MNKSNYPTVWDAAQNDLYKLEIPSPKTVVIKTVNTCNKQGNSHDTITRWTK